MLYYKFCSMLTFAATGYIACNPDQLGVDNGQQESSDDDENPDCPACTERNFRLPTVVHLPSSCISA